MRKGLGFALVGLAVFSVAFAGLLRFWAPSRAEKTPLDLNLTLYGNGSGTFFNSKANKALPVTIRSIRHVRIDSDRSTANTVVARQGLCIFSATGDTSHCPSGADPRILSIVTEVIPADRRNSEAVPGYGSSLDSEKIAHKGLTLKFPFNAAKKTYQFWDYNLRDSRPATYSGTGRLAGLTVYLYEVHTPRTSFDLLPGTKGFYTDDRTIYVEPETGTILKAVDHQVKEFAIGTTAADLTITTADESVKLQAGKAQDGRDEIKLLEVWLPIILLVLGVLFAVGAVITLRGDRREEAGHRTPAHAENDPIPVGQW